MSTQKVYVILLCENNTNSKNSKDNTIMSIQTIEGCNETLNTIRKTAAEDADTTQFVSIFCFDTNLNFNRYIVENTFIDTVKNLSLNFM